MWLGKRILAECAASLIAPVVGGQADDDVALFMRHQHVARTAIMVAGSDDRRQLVIAQVRLMGEGFGILLLKRQFEKATGSGECRPGG